jgi:hypothetical protein
MRTAIVALALDRGRDRAASARRVENTVDKHRVSPGES